MDKKLRKILSGILSLSLVSMPAVFPVGVGAAANASTVRLNPAAASPFNNGEFEGWGTSMGWWGNRIGYSDSLSQQAAEAFFSENGLGLDIVRYNVGGGDNPEHNHVTRSDSKLPCFAVPETNEDGTLKKDENGDVIYTYNWDNDSNQINVLKKIKEQNSSVHIEGYTNSPPWFMTETGCSGGGKITTDSNGKVTAIAENLSPDNYDVFADFLGDVTEHMAQIGLKFDSYSPMNEPDPQTKYWGELSVKQEGNHVAPGDNQSALILALDSEYTERGIDTLIAGLDETSIDYSINSFNKLTDEAKAALDRLDTHTYGGSKRAQLKQTAQDGNKNLWMSEVDGGWNGFGLADRIITDLNGMQASAWVMWDIVDKHKDAGFTAPDGSTPEANNSMDAAGTMWGVGMADHDTQTLELSNKYYTFGQFTRYINPGDTLIESSNSTLAAYNKKTGDIKIVALNSSSSDLPYVFDLSAFTNIGTNIKEIRTNNLTGDAAEHWKEITGEAALDGKKLTTTLKAGTITTYILEGAGATDYAVITGGGNEIGLGNSVTLSLETNLSGNVEWSVSDSTAAEITANGNTAVVKANKSGSVTVYAKIGEFTTQRDFEIPMYKLTGTPSWGNDTTAPSDSADYTKAADGDLNTYFDGTKGGMVIYDYGTTFKPSAIKLAARSGNGMPERTVGGTVQGSNDGISWTDLYKITSKIPSGEYTVISSSQLENDKAYRYFRYINNENMANIAEFSIDGAPSSDVLQNEPVVKDLSEFTDSFESGENIFQAPAGALSADGNQVYASGLDRFKNVFVPVKATAVTILAEPVALTENNRFRLTFNIFSGWETNGKDNTFSLKDANGNEVVSFTINVGSCVFKNINIGGVNALSTTPNAQCRSNMTSKVGANGWNNASQPYRNNVGHNKTAEIIIDGTGDVSISLTGGLEDAVCSGTLTAPVSIKSMELTGGYNASRERVVSYDNFDGDLITYAEPLKPAQTPEPTAAPVMPDSGEIISLNFDNGNLESTSSYGKAEGTPVFTETDGSKCVQFDNSAATAIKLTDANGNSLLTGFDKFTIAFKAKPVSTNASWLFYAAPDDNAQVYLKENYLGIRTQNGSLHTERYKNSGSRSAEIAQEVNQNEWNDVIISVDEAKTTLFVNGVCAKSESSLFKVSDMLGQNSVAYIGKANWGTGEYAQGYIDDFVIYNYALPEIDLGDLSEVKSDLILPETVEGGTVVWTSSNTDIITNDGKVTRPKDTAEVILTAKINISGMEFSSKYTARVMGLTDVINTFTAYAENGEIKFTSEYSSDIPYDMYVALYDGGGKLSGILKNTAEGVFQGLNEEKYTVSCFLWKGEVPVCSAVKKNVNMKNEQEMSAYLFVHFVGNESTSQDEQIYFSVSEDGKTWTTLNDKNPVLTSNVGEKGVRDPYILRGEDGKFFIIATDLSIYNLGLTQGSNRWSYCQTNGSKSIVIWESDDLVNWSEARLVKTAVDSAGCTWAPEAVYDSEKDAYMVFWASKTSEDNYSTQRMYRSYTKDFVTFSKPEVYIDGGNISNIDTTVIKHEGMYYRFTKNESNSSVTMMKSNLLDGSWRDVKTYTIDGKAGDTVTGYEGPTIFKMNGENKWTLLLDYYSAGKGYKPFVTEDISKGEFVSAEGFVTDDTYRHGTVMPITAEEYGRLVQSY